MWYQSPPQKKGQPWWPPRQGFEVTSKPVVEDISTTMGLVNAARLVLRLKPKALLALGMPCNSFGFMSSSQHARCEQLPHGDEKFPFVCTGNMLGYRTAILALIGCVRMAVFFLENPERSKCIILPVLKNIMSFKLLRPQTCKWPDAYTCWCICIYIYMGIWGGREITYPDELIDLLEAAHILIYIYVCVRSHLYLQEWLWHWLFACTVG